MWGLNLLSDRGLREAYGVGIPNEIISKFYDGLGLTEREKGVVRGRGKAYVHSHSKIVREKLILIRPQLRDLPKH